METKQDELNTKKESIKIVFPDIGYPLKSFPLRQWIYDHCLTQTEMALILDIPPDDFKRRLRDNEKFYEFELRTLVYFMGAKDAFNVIYFPTKGIRKKVWDEVFGRYENQEEKQNE